MKLEFTYLWDEWLEASMACQGYSRRGQRAYRRKFLLPLIILFLVSLGCAMLSYSSRSGSLWHVILYWLLTATASLLGLALSYCLIIELLTQIGFRRTWKQARHFRYELDIGIGGVTFISAKSNSKPEWLELSRYFETDNLFILCHQRSWLGVPKRLFHDDEEKKHFLRSIKGLITSNQARYTAAIDR
jgi:hypothetical protein